MGFLGVFKGSYERSRTQPVDPRGWFPWVLMGCLASTKQQLCERAAKEASSKPAAHRLLWEIEPWLFVKRNEPK